MKLELKDQTKIVKLRQAVDEKFFEAYQEAFDRLLLARSVYGEYSDVDLLHYLLALEIRERQVGKENTIKMINEYLKKELESEPHLSIDEKPEIDVEIKCDCGHNVPGQHRLVPTHGFNLIEEHTYEVICDECGPAAYPECQKIRERILERDNDAI